MIKLSDFFFNSNSAPFKFTFENLSKIVWNMFFKRLGFKPNTHL